jgi:hypothetical protein
MRSVIWAIVRKEMLLAIRASKLQVLMSIVFPVIVQFALMQRLTKGDVPAAAQNQLTDNIINMGASIILLYVAPTLIPFLASALLTRSFSEEKGDGALMATLATGINVGMLWAVKTLTIFVYCYFVSLSVLALDVLLLLFYFKLKIAFSLAMGLLILVISPLAALAITGIMSFLALAVRFGGMVASVLPMVITVGLFAVFRTRPTTTVMLVGIADVMLIAISILAMCAYVINKMSRSRILGL